MTLGSDAKSRDVQNAHYALFKNVYEKMKQGKGFEIGRLVSTCGLAAEFHGYAVRMKEREQKIVIKCMDDFFFAIELEMKQTGAEFYDCRCRYGMNIRDWITCIIAFGFVAICAENEGGCHLSLYKGLNGTFGGHRALKSYGLAQNVKLHRVNAMLKLRGKAFIESDYASHRCGNSQCIGGEGGHIVFEHGDLKKERAKCQDPRKRSINGCDHAPSCILTGLSTEEINLRCDRMRKAFLSRNVTEFTEAERNWSAAFVNRSFICDHLLMPSSNAVQIALPTSLNSLFPSSSLSLLGSDFTELFKQLLNSVLQSLENLPSSNVPQQPASSPRRVRKHRRRDRSRSSDRVRKHRRRDRSRSPRRVRKHRRRDRSRSSDRSRSPRRNRSSDRV